MSEEIVFRDPPPPASRQSKGRTEMFGEALAAHPGRWAVYSTGLTRSSAQSMASQYRRRYPHIEWAARPDEDSTYTIFARLKDEH